jgi:sporulation protein YlmC with PRC-barrel domain
MTTQPAILVRLTDSNLTLADADQDIRGRTVLDRDGNEIGKVEDLLIDTEENQVRMLRVEHGGLFGIGATPLFVPVQTVQELTEDEVWIDQSRTDVADGPQYNPDLVDQNTFYSDVYRYYGYVPYWTVR